MAEESITNTKQATATQERPRDGAAEPKVSNGSGAQGPDGDEKKANPARKLIITAVVGAAIVFGAIWGINYWHYSQSHVGTDDAYVTGNLVNVSPIVQGTLKELYVEEGQYVKQGDVIARLDDSGPRAARDQAKAAYDAAESQIPQATSGLAYQEASTKAAILHAQAALQSQYAKTTGAQAQVGLTSSSISHQVEQARQQTQAAAATAAQADAQVGSAQAAVDTARQNVATAQQAANAATATIDSAQANYDRAQSDAKRYAALLGKQAVTQQQYDQAKAAAQSAEAELRATKDQARQAQSQVESARATVAQMLSQLAATRKAASAAHRQEAVAKAGEGVAQANLGQISVQQSNLTSNQGSNAQAQADLQAAQAGQQQVLQKRQQIDTLKAQALQAKAALANAQVALDDTVVRAPSSGEVVKKAVNVGAALSPGQTIATMTAGHEIWVNANFKETQLRDVRPGQEAEIEVDAYPGKIFKGKVQSVLRATGASTALLPPDNATGNFTKVVQRVPIRILILPSNEGGKWANADDINRLSQGMSVTATIDTANSK